MRNTITKEYIPCNKPNSYLKVELYYSLGGYNLFTYKHEPRGYYLSVSPVERGNGMESYTAFTGVKLCVLEVKRRSKKAEMEALAKVSEYKDQMIQRVLNESALEVA